MRTPLCHIAQGRNQDLSEKGGGGGGESCRITARAWPQILKFENWNIMKNYCYYNENVLMPPSRTCNEVPVQNASLRPVLKFTTCFFLLFQKGGI